MLIWSSFRRRGIGLMAISVSLPQLELFEFWVSIFTLCSLLTVISLFVSEYSLSTLIGFFVVKIKWFEFLIILLFWIWSPWVYYMFHIFIWRYRIHFYIFLRNLQFWRILKRLLNIITWVELSKSDR